MSFAIKNFLNHKGHKGHEGKKNLNVLDQFLPTLIGVGLKGKGKKGEVTKIKEKLFNFVFTFTPYHFTLPLFTPYSSISSISSSSSSSSSAVFRTEFAETTAPLSSFSRTNFVTSITNSGFSSMYLIALSRPWEILSPL